MLLPVAALARVALRAGLIAATRVTTRQVSEASIAPALFGIGTVEARRSYRIGADRGGPRAQRARRCRRPRPRRRVARRDGPDRQRRAGCVARRGDCARARSTLRARGRAPRAGVVRILNPIARQYDTAIIVVTHDERIIPTFERIDHVRDGRTHEEAGEGRAVERRA